MNRKYGYFMGKMCEIVSNDDDWWYYRDNESELPTIGAFCKNCNVESAKPIWPIWMNAKPAYLLHCNRCGSDYPMYTQTYKIRYVGYNLPNNGGHINPTHGKLSIKEAMDRKASETMSAKNIAKRVEEKMCNCLNCTPEQYREMKKEWNEERAKAKKRYDRECQKIINNKKNEKIAEESANLKNLIDTGVVKYVNGIGLVNQGTGKVIKL